MRLEMVEYLRLTQAAMGSAKAVSASIASFAYDIARPGILSARQGGGKRRDPHTPRRPDHG
jgi:hypothetical protein